MKRPKDVKDKLVFVLGASSVSIVVGVGTITATLPLLIWKIVKKLLEVRREEEK